jgi:hypothetical protein
MSDTIDCMSVEQSHSATSSSVLVPSCVLFSALISAVATDSTESSGERRSCMTVRISRERAVRATLLAAASIAAAISERASSALRA